MPASYSGMALVYDALSDDIDYDAWAGEYLQMLRAQGFSDGDIADIACGTGNMTFALARRGQSVLGLDISEEMLMIARDKAAEEGYADMFFAHMDMRDFYTPDPVHAAVCANDGLNYLHTPEEAAAFFRCTYDILLPGGAFAFDISSEHKLRAMDGEVFFDDREDMTLLWNNALEGDILEMEISIFVLEPDGRYTRYDENHRQRIWTAGDIERMLSEAGFGDIHIYGQALCPPRENEERLHFSCKKSIK